MMSDAQRAMSRFLHNNYLSVRDQRKTDIDSLVELDIKTTAFVKSYEK